MRSIYASRPITLNPAPIPPPALLSHSQRWYGSIWQHFALGDVLLRTHSHLLGLFLLAGLLIPGGTARSQSPGAADATEPAQILLVRVLLSKSGPALEITASGPLTPQIQQIENPPRLVIDLPGAVMSVRSKKIEVQSDAISSVRLSQLQDNPPVVRAVMDLLKPAEYGSESANDVLTVRLRNPDQVAAAKPEVPPPPTAPQSGAEAPSLPTFTQGVQPAAVPVSTGKGAVMFAGATLAAGSSVTAGVETAVLRLGRGGEVRVCPHTTVSVTASPNGRELMLGMSTGGLEAHYNLDAVSDSILTPDFRILMAGPGEFHYAFSDDRQGNTCVRALPGNTASVIVSELMGDGTYQVKPSEHVVFRSGRLSVLDTSAVPASCGCPPPPEPVMRASAPPASQPEMTGSVRLAQSTDSQTTAPTAMADSGPGSQPVSKPLDSTATAETASLPPEKPEDPQVKVEAPLVFRASDLPPKAPSAPVSELKQLPPTYAQPPTSMETVIKPPAKNKTAKEHHGFFGKLRGFFGAIFR